MTPPSSTSSSSTLPPRFRLYRLPWEGTSSIVFDAWSQLPYVEVVTLELPARLGRAKEKHPKDIRSMAKHLAQAISINEGAGGGGGTGGGRGPSTSSLPFVLFGHSYLGGLLAVEVGLALAHTHHLPPHSVILSGCPSPSLPPSSSSSSSSSSSTYPTRLSSLPTPQLLAFLVSTGALSAHVASNKDTVKSLLPLFKADLAAVDAYMLPPSLPPSLLLPCPILALSTEGDTLATPVAMEGWKAYTSSTFTPSSLPSSSSSSSSSTDRHRHLRPASDAFLKALSLDLVQQPILTKDIQVVLISLRHSPPSFFSFSGYRSLSPNCPPSLPPSLPPSH